jgi:hypothetical protein
MNHARYRLALSAQAHLAHSAKLCRSQERGFAPLQTERESLLNL